MPAMTCAGRDVRGSLQDMDDRDRAYITGATAEEVGVPIVCS